MKQEKQKSYMNKIIVVALILVALLFVGWRLTGNVVSNGNGVVDVIRSPVTNDSSFFIKNVVLTVTSSENVLAIEEHFIGNNCSVIQYEVSPDMDIVQFNPDLNLWLIGNRSSKLVFNLSYSIPENCNVDATAGMVYTLEGGNQTRIVVVPAVNNTVIGGNTNTNNSGNSNTGSGSGGNSGNTGTVSGNNSIVVINSGSNSGNTGTTAVIPVVMTSAPIVQAKDEVELKKLIKTANDRLAAFTDESGGKSDSFYVYAVIGIILVFIIGFVVLIVFTRPKDYTYSDKNLQKFKDEFLNQRTTN